jgi:hypothetical protein
MIPPARLKGERILFSKKEMRYMMYRISFLELLSNSPFSGLGVTAPIARSPKHYPATYIESCHAACCFFPARIRSWMAGGYSHPNGRVLG